MNMGYIAPQNAMHYTFVAIVLGKRGGTTQPPKKWTLQLACTIHGVVNAPQKAHQHAIRGKLAQNCFGACVQQLLDSCSTNHPNVGILKASHFARFENCDIVVSQLWTIQTSHWDHPHPLVTSRMTYVFAFLDVFGLIWHAWQFLTKYRVENYQWCAVLWGATIGGWSDITNVHALLKVCAPLQCLEPSPWLKDLTCTPKHLLVGTNVAVVVPGL